MTHERLQQRADGIAEWLSENAPMSRPIKSTWMRTPVAQVAILLMVFCNIIMGAVALTYLPKPTPRPEFQTLAIWQDDKGTTGVIRWLPGAPSKDDLERMPELSPIPKLKLVHVFTIEGRPVNDEWARSIINLKE